MELICAVGGRAAAALANIGSGIKAPCRTRGIRKLPPAAIEWLGAGQGGGLFRVMGSARVSTAAPVSVGDPLSDVRSTAPRDCHKRVSRMRSGRKAVGPSRVSSAWLVIIDVHVDGAEKVDSVRRRDLGQDLIIDVLSGRPHRFDC